mgnify:CR=1 FL=1
MKDDDLLTQARDHYKQTSDAWGSIYDEARDDLKFVYDVDSGQWPSQIRKERETAGRPMITSNKLQKVLRTIRGDMRQNRPRIKVIPVDDKADPQMADIYNGLIRQIEYLSDAGIAYDTAYMQAISGSVGFFRIRTDYSDEMSFDQDIFIDRILDSTSVHLDPNCREFCYADAQYGFIEELIDEKAYKARFPDSDATNFDGTNTLFGDWISGRKIRVAEYFCKEAERINIALLQSGKVVPLDGKLTPEFYATVLKDPVVRDRETDTHVVKWYLINGGEILEKKDWPGKYIPIIPVFGDEIIVDGKRYYLSLARGAKGPQQMYNYWATAATETVALAPKAPFILDARQVKGFEKEWENSNRENRAWLPYKHIPGVAKPQREHQTEVPTAIMAMMQAMAFDVEDHLGRYEASKGQTSNERSGKAIMARITQADKGTYTFVDNLTRSIIFAGRQLIDLIPKIYDTKRALRIMGDDGEQKVVNVNTPVPTEAGIATVNDLSVGKYDLISTMGASFSSKREEMTQMMIESMQYAPTLAGVIAPLVFKYSDWPGAQEIAAELKKAVDQQQAVAMQQGGNGGQPQ